MITNQATATEKKEAAGAPLKLYMDGTKLNRHIEDVVKWQNGEWFAPLHMELSLTNVCNQKCTFCYTIWSHGREQMDEATVVRLIRSAKKTGLLSALIAGEGEPTANPAYVTAIETAGEVGLDMALNTNAVNLNEENLRRILPHLSWVRFSVQGSTPEHYARIHQVSENHFHKATGNIRRACELKKEMGLNVALGMQQVLINENGNDVHDTARLARDLGCDYYVIKPCHPHELNTGFSHLGNMVDMHRAELERAQSLSTDDFKAIVRWNFLTEAESPRTYGRCLALPFIVQITAVGRIVTCYPQSDKEAHDYGSLHEKDFEEIVRSERFQSVVKWAENNVDVTKCMPTCRQHNANKYLWWLTEEVPDHLNFI